MQEVAADPFAQFYLGPVEWGLSHVRPRVPAGSAGRFSARLARSVLTWWGHSAARHEVQAQLQTVVRVPGGRAGEASALLVTKQNRYFFCAFCSFGLKKSFCLHYNCALWCEGCLFSIIMCSGYSDPKLCVFHLLQHTWFEHLGFCCTWHPWDQVCWSRNQTWIRNDASLQWHKVFEYSLNESTCFTPTYYPRGCFSEGFCECVLIFTALNTNLPQQI